MQRARAVIIKDGKILTIKRTKPEITYWVIPGGGVESNENHAQAITREAKEELGLDIEVNNLILKVVSKKPETIGQEEYFYLCNISGGVIGSGDGPEYKFDSKYIGGYDIEWIEINRLKDFDLKPVEIRDLIYDRFHK